MIYSRRMELGFYWGLCRAWAHLKTQRCIFPFPCNQGSARERDEQLVRGLHLGSGLPDWWVAFTNHSEANISLEKRKILTVNSSSCGLFAVKAWDSGTSVPWLQSLGLQIPPEVHAGKWEEKETWKRRENRKGEEKARASGTVRDKGRWAWNARKGEGGRGCRGIIDYIPWGDIYQPLMRCEKLTGLNRLKLINGFKGLWNPGLQGKGSAYENQMASMI